MFCSATFQEPFRLRRHQATSPPKPPQCGMASGAGSVEGQAALISMATLTLHPERKSSPFYNEYCAPTAPALQGDGLRALQDLVSIPLPLP